jgi:hypothetical protein
VGVYPWVKIGYVGGNDPTVPLRFGELDGTSPEGIKAVFGVEHPPLGIRREAMAVHDILGDWHSTCFKIGS